ncbi:MAG: hypothetical protein ACOCW5_05250 [Spirochaetia bacterium]
MERAAWNDSARAVEAVYRKSIFHINIFIPSITFCCGDVVEVGGIADECILVIEEA